MIVRVTINNLALVDYAEFCPGASLTAVTGETGAGKTLLATAIQLLFGADTDARMVGDNGNEAWVEGEFEVADSFWHHPDIEPFVQVRPEPGSTLVLARRIAANGRSRALAWGRTVAKTDLAAAGRHLVATAGQHSQRRLMSGTYQRALLDDYGAATIAPLAESMSHAWEQLVAARNEYERLTGAAETLATDAQIAADDLARIDAVAPSIDDEAQLVRARDRARHRDAIIRACGAAIDALDSSESARSAVDSLGVAYAGLQDVSDIDPTLGAIADSLLGLQSQATDIAADLHRFVATVDAGDGMQLDDIEDRLLAYDDLKRRSGGTIESVLLRWADLREQVADAGDIDARIEAALDAVRIAESQAITVADSLHAARCSEAERLADEVAVHLSRLGMESSRFVVGVERVDLGATGCDRVELRLAATPEGSPQPIASIASGGELSRIALALHVAGGVDGVGTLIFDEIDAGIGGHTAHAIGSLLRQLAEHTQVICVTHLPQVASRAQQHVRIDKAGGRTSLTALRSEDDVIDELCRMLGADPTDASARDHLRSLRGPRLTSSATQAGHIGSA